MAPPARKAAPKGKGSLLQSYLTINQEESNVISVDNPEEEADTEVTYFVDEEGRYYYQSAGENQGLVSIPTEATADDDSPVENNHMLVDEDGFQTVTLMPTENGNDVSYVLVVQEESKPVINIKEEQGADDVYNFEEDEEQVEEEGEEEEEEAEEQTAKKGKAQGRRGRHVRPQFSCNRCSYASHRRYLLVRHIKSHSEERPHKCNVCERGFKTLASLMNHVNMHNKIKPHVCKYCNTPFTTSGELVRHVRYKHTHEKPHKCTECDYAAVELSKLRRHIRCHTGERPYQCPHCTYASPDTFKLKRHLRTHTGEKPYQCEHCNMCFTQSNSLKAHRLIHNVSDKPVFQCELCPAKCGRKTDLRIHVQKLHTSDKPLKCKRCGKSFPDRYSCKMHNKTHEGEKCFKCNLCPYASTTLRHLRSHALKHTDEKPFVCDQCDQSFRQKQLLRRHQNLYHNPDYVKRPPKEKTHSCHECNRTFAHKGNLIRHLAVHDPESGHQEKALALKVGREKKVVRQTKNSDSDSDSDDSGSDSEDAVKFENTLKRGELVAVADGDGQQYVVLEVIHLEDGTQQQVAVVAPPNYANEQEMMEQDEQEQKEAVKQIKDTKNIKLEKEVDSCFGFDDEDGEEEGELTYTEKEVVLGLV